MATGSQACQGPTSGRWGGGRGCWPCPARTRGLCAHWRQTSAPPHDVLGPRPPGTPGPLHRLQPSACAESATFHGLVPGRHRPPGLHSARRPRHRPLQHLLVPAEARPPPEIPAEIFLPLGQEAGPQCPPSLLRLQRPGQEHGVFEHRWAAGRGRGCLYLCYGGPGHGAEAGDAERGEGRKGASHSGLPGPRGPPGHAPLALKAEGLHPHGVGVWARRLGRWAAQGQKTLL